MNFFFKYILIHSFARWRILIIFQLISGYCLAELSELKVYSPIVNKGDIGLEILGNTRFDDDEDKSDSDKDTGEENPKLVYDECDVKTSSEEDGEKLEIPADETSKGLWNWN